jgi:hypothetical protein
MITISIEHNGTASASTPGYKATQSTLKGALEQIIAILSRDLKEARAMLEGTHETGESGWRYAAVELPSNHDDVEIQQYDNDDNTEIGYYHPGSMDWHVYTTAARRPKKSVVIAEPNRWRPFPDDQ